MSQLPQPVWNAQHGKYLHISQDASSGRQYWTHYVEDQGWIFFQWCQTEHHRVDSGSSGAAQASAAFQRGMGQAIQGTYDYAQPASNSHFERLDPSFYVRHGKFFQPGRVFSVLFSEGAGSTATRYNDSISTVKYGEQVHSQIRRFVVVRARNGFAYSVNKGTSKPGVVPSEHAIAYSYGYLPVPLAGETALEKDPICIIMNPGEPALSTASRIFFGIQHPIQYNVKVKDLGYVHPDHLVKFLGYWAMEHQLGTAQDMQDIGEDDDGSDHPNATNSGYLYPQATQDIDEGGNQNINPSSTTRGFAYAATHDA